MAERISSELKEKIKLEIGEYLLKELEKYPSAYEEIRSPMIVYRGVPLIEFPKLIPIIETIIIIAQTAFLLMHGKIIIENWKHAKTIEDLILRMKSSCEESEKTIDVYRKNADRINKISNEMNDLNNKMVNSGVPNDVAEIMIVNSIIDTVNLIGTPDDSMEHENKRS